MKNLMLNLIICGMSMGVMAERFSFSILRDAAILTEEETINRRKVKIAKLLKLYKLQYRRLQDILRTRHELYVKRMEKLNERDITKHGKTELGEISVGPHLDLDEDHPRGEEKREKATQPKQPSPSELEP